MTDQEIVYYGEQMLRNNRQPVACTPVQAYLRHRMRLAEIRARLCVERPIQGQFKIAWATTSTHVRSSEGMRSNVLGDMI